MFQSIVHEFGPITLVGGGSASVEDLTHALSMAPTCVAVDGGLVLALEAGVMPAAVIGDMDSAPDDAIAQIPSDRFHKIPEQNSTDFDKALRSVTTPLVVAVGFTGLRIDHQLASFHTLLVRQDQPCILLGENEIVMLAPRHITLPTQAGDVISLFPLLPVTGRSSGLEWPIDGLAFDPAKTSGTSNRATGEVALWMDAPGMLLIAPRSLLAAAVQALSLSASQASRWPVRA
ncbi:thiamine diphosphokinase [Sulfitobacter sp. SK012]|nr:thiamine diphosphokinase [Sulfitobacter sp. SK012]